MIRSAGLLVVLALSARLVLAGDDYAPRDGRYSVRFPGKPKATSQRTKTPTGELNVETATYATNDGNIFMVSYTDFPVGAATADIRNSVFDAARDGLKGKDGKLRADKNVKVGSDKLQGRDIELENGKQRLRCRLVLRGDRLYQIAAIGTPAFTGSKQAEAFIASFEVSK